MILPQLSGIHPQDVRKRETSSLEVLLKLGDKILKEPDLKEVQEYLRVGEYYKSRVSQISYDARDIESFILAHADKTYTEEQWKKLGVFTGALVSALTQKEKQTTVSIDLGNRTFHYLFAWTSKANNIIIRNLTGNYAFWNAGGNGGRVRNITGVNITGNNTFSFAGSDNGIVKSITGINIAGEYTFEFAGGFQGSVGKIIGIQVQGNDAFFGAGIKKGSVGVIRYYDISGMNFLAGANVRQKIRLTPQQAEKYIEIVSAGKNSEEIHRIVEQLNLLGGKE